ncbi:uncharacterized protein LOC117215828 [Bombus bifarius]|uniref:Uncharacterized protein LOC117215828 n=1 Tax=Bombus bifarius TaxID=103933 RepID=A0A6P8NVW0_9HYME|nr:uncharacterized protein LOC117161868 [Bombus vancouverensis nearcticus]XP_033318217.1 uncharacterized protein LOC117215828 [Bombus bifarius]
MAEENKKDTKNQVEELYAWISKIPLSKSTKNLSRDLSDAVIIAEILKMYYPRYVDLHNYVPANSLTTKTENWKVLNRKVLNKIDMKLTKNVINQLVNCHPGAAENMLLEIRKKIIKDGIEPRNLQDLPQNDSIEEGNNVKVMAKLSKKSMSSPTGHPILKALDCKRSIFTRAKEMFYFILEWLISWLYTWNYFQNIKFQLENQNSLKEDAEASRTQRTSENINEEDAVPRHVYAQLRRKIRKIDDIICTLNHKLAYLESTIKLKDLRISNLTSEIIDNTVESKQFAKNQINDAQTSIA